jgi:hypothetical protein
LETVPTDTLARRATSLIDARRRDAVVVMGCSSGSGASSRLAPA